MTNVNEFKNFATSIWVPDYFREYVQSLDDEKLEWFYNQVKEVLKILISPAYLTYKFKWICKREFTDLSKEIYVEYLYNPECFDFDIIKPEWEDILADRYRDDKDVRRYYSHYH